MQAIAIEKGQKKLTYADFARLTPPNSGDYELHDGKIIEMASPIPLHQDVALALAALIRAFCKKNDLGKTQIAPLDIVFDELNTLQPDIFFIKKDRLKIIGAKNVEGAPDFIVEILSDSNSPKEMSYKRHIYESFMVREYWIVNLQRLTITQLVNDEGEFRQVGVFSKEATVESDVLSGFKISLNELLEA